MLSPADMPTKTPSAPPISVTQKINDDENFNIVTIESNVKIGDVRE